MISSRSLDLINLDAFDEEQIARLTSVLEEALEGQVCPDEAIGGLIEEHPDLAEPLNEFLVGVRFLQQAADGLEIGATLQSLENRTIGDFRILRELGRGGMGIVYEAEQQSLQRRVALKVLPPGLSLTSNQVARFRNEAHAAASLQHEHIVPIYEVGERDGIHYFAMQCIEGASLEDVVAAIKLPRNSASEKSPLDGFADLYAGNRDEYFREMVQLTISAANAIHAAHETGIVHRDIKPSNLLVDSSGKAWVTDFGLARCQTNSALTQTGDLLGTMRYMSPEQSGGTKEHVDHRTDVYSLGVTLYELLTLRSAVRGDSVAEMARQLERGRPYRPKLWDKQIPADLETIVLKAIEKEREDRYSSAAALAQDLQRFLDRKPVLARAPSWRRSTSKWFRRNPSTVFGILAILLLTTCGLGLVAYQLNAAKAAMQSAHQQASSSDYQYRGQLARTKNHLALLLARQGRPEEAQASINEAIRLQEALLLLAPTDTQIRRDLASTLNNRGQLELGDDEQRETDYRAAIAQLQIVIGQDKNNTDAQVELGLLYSNLASHLRREDKLREAWEAGKSSVTILARLQSTESPQHAHDYAVANNNLGLIYFVSDNLEEARTCFETAFKACQSRVESEPDKRQVRAILRNLTKTLRKLGHHQRAKHYQQWSDSLEGIQT